MPIVLKKRKFCQAIDEINDFMLDFEIGKQTCERGAKQKEESESNTLNRNQWLTGFVHKNWSAVQTDKNNSSDKSILDVVYHLQANNDIQSMYNILAKFKQDAGKHLNCVCSVSQKNNISNRIKDIEQNCAMESNCNIESQANDVLAELRKEMGEPKGVDNELWTKIERIEYDCLRYL